LDGPVRRRYAAGAGDTGQESELSGRGHGGGLVAAPRQLPQVATGSRARPEDVQRRGRLAERRLHRLTAPRSLAGVRAREVFLRQPQSVHTAAAPVERVPGADEERAAHDRRARVDRPRHGKFVEGRSARGIEGAQRRRAEGPDEDHAVCHRRRPEGGGPVLLPRDRACGRVESVHGRLLDRGVARVVRVARLAAEIAQGGAAVGPLAVEGGRADEAARKAAEDDVGPPHELAAEVVGETVEDVVGPVLAAYPEPSVRPEIDDVRGRTEVEVADVALTRTVRPPDPAAPRAQRQDGLVVGGRRVGAAIRRAEEDEVLLLVDRARAPYVTAAPVLTLHLAVDTHGVPVRVEHGVDLEAPALFTRAGIERDDPAA